MSNVTKGLMRDFLGVYHGFVDNQGVRYFFPVSDGTIEPPDDPEPTLQLLTAPSLSVSEGTKPSEVPYDAEITITPGNWQWVDAEGVTQTGTPPGTTYEFEIDGVSAGTGTTLAAGDVGRIGASVIGYETAIDPVVTDYTIRANSDEISPIRDQDTTPEGIDSLQILDGDWGVMPGQYVDENDTDIVLPNPNPAVNKWVPRFWIKFSSSGYGGVDPSAVAIAGVQWGAGSAVPIPEANFEPAEFEQTLGDGRHVYRFSLRDKTGDRWDLVPRPNDAVDFTFTIRTRFDETRAWPAEAATRKAVVQPPDVAKPSIITNWTVAPHSSGDDGRITITIASGQPSSWGDGTAGVVQWWNSADGWQNVPSLSFNTVLPDSLHGAVTTIKVRGLSAEGIEGTEDSKTVDVPGSVTFPEVWRQAAFPGLDAYNQGTSNGYREGYAGYLYQFFHCGDVFYNPNHAEDGNVAIWAMDVHPGWICGNHSESWPVLMSPEFDGIRGRHGIACKIDREQPNRHVWMMSERGNNSRGGLYVSTDYSRTIAHEYHTTDGNGIEFIGGQGGNGSSQYRAWHRLIQQNVNNPLQWCVVSRRAGGKGGLIIRSSNRGQSWTQAGTINQQWVYCLAQDANGRLIYGSENGLHIVSSFTSNSFGAGSWPGSIPQAARTQIIGIECHPTDARYGYVSTFNGGCYRTADGFQTFTQIAPQGNSYCNVFASPWNFNNVWLIGLNNGGSTTGRMSVFTSNGLQGAAGTGTSGSPSWNQFTMESKTYGWPKPVNGGDNKPNAPGTNRQMQIGVVPCKSPSTGHKRAHLHFKAQQATTENGYNFKVSADGLDHAGGGDSNAIALAWSKTDSDVCALGGYDNATMMSRNNWGSFYTLNMGEITTVMTIAPNRANSDWIAILSGGYGSGHIAYSKNANNVPTTNRKGSSTTPLASWTKPSLGSNHNFVSFGQGSGGQNLLWTSFHRCTNFNSGSPTFQNLTNSSGFTSGMEMVMVSAYDTNVAYARKGSQIWRTNNGGNSFFQYCDMGGAFATGFWVDPKDHDVVEWFHNTQGYRSFNGSSYSTIDASVSSLHGGAARRVRICPVSNTRYMLYYAMGSKRFGLLRSKNGGQFTPIMRYLPRSEAIRSIDVCPHTGILYQLGTVGTRYFPPPVINALCQERLNLYKARESLYGGEATLALL